MVFMNAALVIIVLFLFSDYVHGRDFNIEQVEFVSHSARLSGSIVFPENSEIHSAVVFVHGSGKQKRNIYWAKRFASAGIAALVYDKRGVGQSEGVFESKQSVGERNINLLADDSIAALAVLRKHSRTKALPLGLTGISQAGWIVPLAAERSRAVDYMVLWSGPVCKVSEEDIFSKHTSDLDGPRIPTYDEALRSRKTKYIWPRFLGKDIDPSDSLEKLSIPGLWIFGGNDGSIPVDLSVQRLTSLISSGRKYEYILFSNLGHNNMDDTFLTVVNWIMRLAPTSNKLHSNELQ